MPSIFYDDTKPNNNLNFKASNYSNQQGYSIRMRMNISTTGVNSLGVAGVGLEQFISGAIEVNDYGQDQDGDLDFNLVALETQEVDTGKDLGGTLSLNSNTRIKSTYISSQFIIGDPSEFDVIHRLERSDNAATSIEEASSIKQLRQNGVFIVQEDRQIMGANYISSVIVDASKIDPSILYNITSRIFPLGVTPIQVFSFQTNADSSVTAFQATVLPNGYQAIWTLPDLTQVVGDTVVSGAGGFNGQVNTVTVQPQAGDTDYSNITSFNVSFAGSDIVGDLDLTLLTGLTQVAIANNQDIDTIQLANGLVLSSFGATLSSIQALDFSNVTFSGAFLGAGAVGQLASVLFNNLSPNSFRTFGYH